MELKTFWTDNAISNLEDIFDHYKHKVSVEIAKKITAQIFNKTLLLERNPGIGQKEELLSDRENDYRYLVVGNYKVIYWIEEHLIKISSVFDCRQNPKKLKE